MKKIILEVAQEVVRDMFKCGVITIYQKNQYENIIFGREMLSKSIEKAMENKVVGIYKVKTKGLVTRKKGVKLISKTT